VKGGTGTRTHPSDFSVPRGADITVEHRLSCGEGSIMSNSLYRAARCRDLADECHAIAALCDPSTEMRTHYSRMAEHYGSLAEAEELSMLVHGG
jgi:hypothetical protein